MCIVLAPALRSSIFKILVHIQPSDVQDLAVCFDDDSSVYQYRPASVRPCGLALLAAVAAACSRLRSATLAEHRGPCNDTGYEFPDFLADAHADASGKACPVDSLTESLPRLSALTALALHDVHAELGPLLAALPAAKQLRQLSLVEAGHGGGGGGRAAPLPHALSALTNMHTLQVCTFFCSLHLVSEIPAAFCAHGCAWQRHTHQRAWPSPAHMSILLRLMLG